jgi:hypothetical protein
MSNDLITAAWKKSLPPNQMLVIICLCDWANDDGVCWPSLDRIAWKTGLSKRSVQRIIATFEDLGIVTKTRRYHTSTIYRVNLTPLRSKTPFESSGQSDTCQLGTPPNEGDNDESEVANQESESANGESQSDKLWPPIHQYDPSDRTISLYPEAHSQKERMRGTPEEEFLYQELRGDKRTIPALRAGKVPISRYDDAILHAAQQALAHGATKPDAYARTILNRYHENPWYEETREDRRARGLTDVRPG